VGRRREGGHLAKEWRKNKGAKNGQEAAQSGVFLEKELPLLKKRGTHEKDFLKKKKGFALGGEGGLFFL